MHSILVIFPILATILDPRENFENPQKKILPIDEEVLDYKFHVPTDPRAKNCNFGMCFKKVVHALVLDHKCQTCDKP